MVIIAHDGDPAAALQEQREFYELLGRAISQWSVVEDGVYHTFRVVIDPKNWVSMAAAFHSIVNLGTKSDMIEAAIKTSRQHKQYLEEWKKLRRKLRKFSGKRARLAHWSAVQSATPDESIGVRIFLRAPTYDFESIGEDGKREVVSAKQIAVWTSCFAELGMQVDQFWRRLSSQGTS